ncbi:integrin-linked kinase-associated serine/threonine phosphatase 2C-like isoform X2 [Acanthaster planci]|uniref:Integrin-linked kinase-associated serine/threonine phosphatase 2C-like isoform X2 n=1 Tax=Acanthaster planci TaxID=133434 RepID=A0A8B7YAR8_ACAPL|nr:integrin-linked kinase-associated serine/threonine phosphatase 2C-like isoform X2 [Acanthaster planci]
MDAGNQEGETAVSSPTGEAIFSMEKVAEDAMQGGKRKTEETTEGEPELKRRVSAGSGLYQFQSFSAERKGEREDMQDACTLLDDCTESFSTLPSTVSRIAYFAVFDGHSGARASQHAAQTLHQNLFGKFPKTDTGHNDKEIKRCLLDTFKLTDEAFLKQASAQKPVWKDGSTAVCVMAVNNVLYIANLGDSDAVSIQRADPEAVVDPAEQGAQPHHVRREDEDTEGGRYSQRRPCAGHPGGLAIHRRWPLQALRRLLRAGHQEMPAGGQRPLPAAVLRRAVEGIQLRHSIAVHTKRP